MTYDCCCLLLLVLLAYPLHLLAACDQSDLDSLLSFLNFTSVASPLDWSSSTDCCTWEGVACDYAVNGSNRVTHLLLPFRGLAGTISPSLTNLTYLSHLNLSHNGLSGSLPSRFFLSLSLLQILDLSFNALSNPLPFPSSSGTSVDSVIQIVDLSSNFFSGSIPFSVINHIASSGTLTSFNLSNNKFTGPIPTSVCPDKLSSSSLRFLDFSSNGFTGKIDAGLGKCSNLQVFRAGANNLTGVIPSDLYEALAMEEISLPLNQLSGNINSSIAALTSLRILELCSNQLTGNLPTSLTNCRNLEILMLRLNNLEGDLSAFNFSNFQNLTTLDLGNNNFSGTIPTTLYSCKSLKAVRLTDNQLEGEISPAIVELQSLSFLSISKNNLRNISGAIGILAGCENLGTLLLSRSYSGEALPSDFDFIRSNGFQNLQVLAIGACQFTGQVPNWISKLGKLEVLDLSLNSLTGVIPPWLGDLPYLFYIDFSHNGISGEFPLELCNLPALIVERKLDPANQSYLALPVFVTTTNDTFQQPNQLSSFPPSINLRNNSVDGNIPAEIGRLRVMHVLDLSNNNFTGSIPDEISDLINLERLDFSGNHLTGRIPSAVQGLHFLSWFDVANNDLQGPIPTGGQFDTFPSSNFEGNPGLCGPPLVHRLCLNQTHTNHLAHRKSFSTWVIFVMVFSSCLAIAVVGIILAIWVASNKRIISREDNEKTELDTISVQSNCKAAAYATKIVLFPNNDIKDLTMFDILSATDNFDQEHIIGCGGFGLVYKATLPNGTKLAVKKLTGDTCLMEREFKAEIEALSAAQHHNLVTLQGYGEYGGSWILIYTLMENGSLDYWLHEREDGPLKLDWPTRLKIAQGAGAGLAYMHQICEPHIVHRDIKSSNILLDDKFKAHVADFGLSRLINPYKTHVTTELVGTLGYIPPEYGQAWTATLRGDVYSFGVVMLELLTGKRPMDVWGPKIRRELVTWVEEMREKGRVKEVLDLSLVGKGFEEEMIQVLDVACMCVNQNPFKRPSIKDVVDWLNNVGGTHQTQNKDF